MSAGPGQRRFMSGAVQVLAVTCLLAGAAGTVRAADEPPAAETPASNPGFFQRMKRGIGNAADGVGSSIGGVLGRMPDRALITTLDTGPYVKSNEALGDDLDVESKRVRGFGLVAWPEMQGYGNPVWQRLKDASGLQGVPGSLYVLPGSELDASSTADANVFVSLGYLRSLKSEDEFAALLAHELSHVLLHHHDSNVISRTQKQMRDWFAAGSLLMNQIDKLDQLQQSGNATLSAGQTRALRKMQLSIRLTEGAVQPAWGRRQETEADRLGYDLLVKAGYSGSAMNRLLQIIADYEEEQAKVRAAAQDQLQSGVEALVTSGKFDDALNKTSRSATDQLVERLGARHDDAGKRLEALSAYIDKFSPDARRVALTPALYETRAPLRQVLQDYDDTFKAMTLAADGAQPEALRMLTKVTGKGGPIAAHALPNTQSYEVLKSMNREKEGLGFLRRSLQAPEPSWDAFKQMARYNKRQGDATAVLRTGDAALARFKGTPALYPELISFYSGEGYADKARELQETCASRFIDYRDECSRALKKK